MFTNTSIKTSMIFSFFSGSTKNGKHCITNGSQILHLIKIVLVKGLAFVVSVTGLATFGDPKIFQNLNVSSAPADATVPPSGI